MCCIWIFDSVLFIFMSAIINLLNSDVITLKNGGAGDRTRGLSHAKRTLYHWATPPHEIIPAVAPTNYTEGCLENEQLKSRGSSICPRLCDPWLSSSNLQLNFCKWLIFEARAKKYVSQLSFNKMPKFSSKVNFSWKIRNRTTAACYKVMSKN
jgi:hypothetical protein